MSDFQISGRAYGRHFANTTVSITPLEALALRNAVEHYLEHEVTWPELQIQVEDFDNNLTGQPDKVKKVWTTCPHCKAVDSGVLEVDQSRRGNSGEFEAEGDKVFFSIDQQDSDFHTLWFVCEACNKPITLPTDVDISWG